MSIHEMEAKARELRQIQRIIEEAQAEAEAIKDELKAAMGDRESVQAGEYKLTWKNIKTSRFDAVAFRNTFPEFAKEYTKETTVRRFVVA